MPKTIIKSRLHSKNTKRKLNKNIKKLNETYLIIFEHLNKVYYRETALLNINSFFNVQVSSEDFQLLEYEAFVNSIIKRDFTKKYQQQGAQLNQSDQNIE